MLREVLVTPSLWKFSSWHVGIFCWSEMVKKKLDRKDVLSLGGRTNLFMICPLCNIVSRPRD
jgi:hypothetical protein